MSVNKIRQFCTFLFVGITTFFLTGCKLEVLNPKGMIAKGEARLLIESTLLMLIIVVPVLLLTIIIAWRYRESNKKAQYKPSWGHSNAIEAVCWAIPCVIITILAGMTWVSTHKLDPYRPIKIQGRDPIVIQAVALDWKWLFIFPKQHIATINYFEIPVHTPVRFEITADAPMNSLEIPRLAGQIYAMGGMRTILHMTADHPGVYRGLSTNYSGDGFAGMHFSIKAGSMSEFNNWVQHVQQTSPKWSLPLYRNLVRPSKNNKPEFFTDVPSYFFMNTIIGQFLDPKKAASVGSR